MTTILITFEEHGFPVELMGRRDIERAIATGRLRADTIVRVHADGGSTTTFHARDVAELQPLLGIDPTVKPAHAPPAPPPKPLRPKPPTETHRKASRPAAASAVQLQKGQNVVLWEPRDAPGALRITVSCLVDPSTPIEIDFSAFVLRAGGKVGADTDLIFYNNDCGDGGAIRRHSAAADMGVERADSFELTPAALTPDVERICFAASIDVATHPGRSFREVRGASIAMHPAAARAAARFDFKDEAAIETALILGEVYRRGDGWKFRAVGQGYAGGLSALATAFGLEVDNTPSS